MDEKLAHLSFSLSPIGPKGFLNLISVYGSASAAWEYADRAQFKQAGIGSVVYDKFQTFKQPFAIDDYVEMLAKAGVDYIPYTDKFYPKSLKKIPNPPIGIFVRGNRELLTGKDNIGVVGTRKMTSYGARVTETIVSELASTGLIVVSGMALGVDAAAHKAAISVGGLTIAVLGCGVDCPYPRENEKLYQDIIDSGGLIISEYPLGMQANKGTFPARNRVIGAISSGILVCEAGDNSGSLITAEFAKKLEKPVFAVPGPITSQVSRGSYKLLKEGAVMVSSAQDILAELKIKSQKAKLKNEIQNIENLNPYEKKILKAIANEEKTIDSIAKETNISTMDLSVIISELEIRGIIKSSGGLISLS